MGNILGSIQSDMKRLIYLCEKHAVLSVQYHERLPKLNDQQAEAGRSNMDKLFREIDMLKKAYGLW